MKKRLSAILLFISICFCSCNPTYYITKIDSNEIQTTKKENGEIIINNDSIQIIYSFRGINGPIKMEIFNKMDKPLYVDWEKSSLIIDDIAIDYYKRNINIEGQIENSVINISRGSLRLNNDGTFSGIITEQEKNIDFIPPRTKIKRNSTASLGAYIKQMNLKNKEYITKKIKARKNGETKAEIVDFSYSTSPFYFKSYLTMYTDPRNPIAYEHNFYISNIIKRSNLYISEEFINREDIYILKQK